MQLRFSFALVLTLTSTSAFAQMTNPSFETGFTGWQRTGATARPDATSAGCIDGNSCAFVTTCDPTEESCYLVSEAPAGQNAVMVATGVDVPGVEGSVICSDPFSVAAPNTMILPSVMILTEEFYDSRSNDSFFITLNGEESFHVDIGDVPGWFAGTVPTGLASYYHHATNWLPYQTCVFEPGTVSICVGVMDTSDADSRTAILADLFQVGSGGGYGCPGFTYAHDDTLDLTMQEDDQLDIPTADLLANDADITNAIVDVSNVQCGGGIPATAWVGGSTVSFVPPTDFPGLPGSADWNTCSFDYTIQGPTSPYDATLTTSTATVTGIQVNPGQTCGPACLEADMPMVDTGYNLDNPVHSVEDTPLTLDLLAWANDDDASEHVYLEVLLSEGSLIGPAVPDGDPGHCGGVTPIDIPGGGWACPLSQDSECTTQSSLPLPWPFMHEECSGPSDYLGPTVWIVAEDDIPNVHYLPVENRANVFMDGTCGPLAFPCSSDGAPISISVDAVAFEELNPNIRRRASLPDPFDVHVGEEPDPPSVSASDVIGVEDNWVTLDVSATIIDDDLSEVMSLQMSGVPGSAQLNQGTAVGGGVWTLTPADLSGLAIEYTGNPDHNDANIALTLTAISTEVLSSQYDAYDPSTQSPQAVTQAPFTVVVNAVGDEPMLTVGSSVTTTEDVAAQLTITPTLVDADGSEVLTVVIENVPDGVTFSAGSNISAGEWLFTAAEIAGGVSVIPVLHDDTDLTLDVVAFATEQIGQCGTAPGGGGSECTSDGDCSATTCHFDNDTAYGTITVTVDAVADAPQVTATNVSGPTNGNLLLSLSAALVDQDGSEELTLEVSGVEGTLSAGTDQGGGVWTLTPAQLTGLTLNSPTPVDATFTLTATATESGAENGVDTLSSSSSVTFEVDIVLPNQPPSFDPGANQLVSEDAGPQTVSGWATNIQPGPASESSQTVSFLVTTDNDALFATLPALSAGGELTFTPADETSGQATVAVVARDDGGTAFGGDDTADPETFTITVTSVNDAPEFVAPSPTAPITAPAGTAMTFTAAATDVDDGDTVTLSATGLPDGATFTAATGEFAWTPGYDQAGQHEVVVTATDGRAPVTLTVTINVTVTDADNDGVPDDLETAWGLDPTTNDSDDDGIVDATEVGDDWDNPANTDGDSDLDALDSDSDDDGIPDSDEAGDTDRSTPPVDTDQDGTPDFRDTDSDDDTVGDALDNCRLVANTDQADGNHNQQGDACDGWTPSPDPDGCDCRSTPTPAYGALLLLAIAVVNRQRKRTRELK